MVTVALHGRLPFLWFGIFLLAAIVLPDRVWNTLLVGLAGLFLIAAVWAWQLAFDLEGERQLSFPWVAVGDRLEEQLSIHNTSQVPALWAEVVDYSNVPGYTAAVVRSVSPQWTDRWRQSAICTRRGQFHIGPWEIRCGDPFGIFTVTHHYPQLEEIIIHPPIHGQLPLPLPAGQSSGHARARHRAWRATINAASVRDYQTGDPFNWIHWPISARRDQLTVRQFDLDVGGDLWVVLDLQATSQLGEGVAGTEEHLVLLAAALAARALRQTRRVGLAAYGQHPQVIPTGYGAGQQWKMLRALALLKADGTASLPRALRDLSRIARRGATAVILTPTNQTDWLPDLLSLAQCGVQSHVVLLDRPSFGDPFHSAGLREAIRRLGFNCSLIQQGQVGQPLETAERRGFLEFKITPTGRAIPIQTGSSTR